MKLVEESEDIKKINEMFVNVLPSLSERITNSIYYNKLKYFMFNEIVSYCKEKIELKEELLRFREYIGDFLSEEEICEYLDGLKDKYNNSNDNIGIEYHIETTRIDYGVCVFCIIKRDDIYVKKLIFRFRKNPTAGLTMSGLTNANMLLPEKDQEEIRKAIYNDIKGGNK